MILMRATVHLPGLTGGTEALVDPTNQVIRSYIEAEYLIPVELTPETLALLEEIREQT